MINEGLVFSEAGLYTDLANNCQIPFHNTYRSIRKIKIYTCLYQYTSSQKPVATSEENEFYEQPIKESRTCQSTRASIGNFAKCLWSRYKNTLQSRDCHLRLILMNRFRYWNEINGLLFINYKLQANAEFNVSRRRLRSVNNVQSNVSCKDVFHKSTWKPDPGNLVRWWWYMESCQSSVLLSIFEIWRPG